ncbi:hypothetical protein TSUD_40040 [Trifolium subterraneum]|uniref:Amino acid transporter transmembrane domain-containing protein n=1 Tax=Trifolium subterraneum TaxID=3900 RepID=A0A2Z6MJX9_TRISU|nr:hypothetical protein TSUD_40040 [Trifolium subterraneum]
MVSIPSQPSKEIQSEQKGANIGPARHAKWWYSTFHTVTAMIGAGVLSLPYAMAYLGCYSTIAWVACLSRGRIDNVSYAYKPISKTDLLFRIFNALGQISFAFAGHAVTLEIQATIPSTPEKPSKIPMWKGALGAYFINAICYFPVYAMPVFDLIEGMMMRRLNFPPGVALRLVARSAYVAFTLIFGVTFPFFGDLLGFFGGFGFAPTSYFLPSIMWLIIKKPRKYSINWFINWGSIYIGVCIMLASTVGGLRNIIADSSTYSFYT